MNYMGLIRQILFLLIPMSLTAKPVSVDEIFTNAKQFKILGNFTYINVHHSNIDIVQIPQPNGSIISVPIQNKLNQDYLNFSLQARYGIVNRLEIFSTLNTFWQQSHFEINSNFSTQQKADFDSFNLGFIIQAKKEGKAPALFVGGSVDVVDKIHFSNSLQTWQYGKSYSLFALSFYTVDPLVFALQTNIRFHLPQDFNSMSFQQANIYSFNPMLYFAVNPFVSLNAGIRYQYNSVAYTNGHISQSQGSSISYIFGVAYEIKSHLILFVNTESFNAAQYSSDALSLMISYKL